MTRILGVQNACLQSNQRVKDERLAVAVKIASRILFDSIISMLALYYELQQVSMHNNISN